ncbi:MAG: ATP phosphoribosyltransferase regulatory subunit, partial [Salinisphaera sp.]|nr:ATP phosphoribosyltransferase regulatory subunit [Salinisphaera sp.]
YWRWGYDLIRPPLIEYLDSLLTGAGSNLDLHTFKLTDQLSGRMLGVRSDMTTQAARIDAHRLPVSGPARYCYIGSVLRTRTEEPGGSRAPLQIGVELFGHAGMEGDLEVLSLMLETLHELGIDPVCLDLGHVAIYRNLVEHAGIVCDVERRLFDVMQRKSAPDLQAMVDEGELAGPAGATFAGLMNLHGDASILDRARLELGARDARIGAALDSLERMVERLARHYPQVPVYLDLAELHGYRYKTGMVFAAFAPGLGRELARGGRYDNVGAAFGRARAATGFSADLNVLAALGNPAGWTEESVRAPADDDPALHTEIRRLRADGRRVVVQLPDEDTGAAATACLVWEDGGWRCRPIAGEGGRNG